MRKLNAIQNVILPLTYRHDEKHSAHEIKAMAMAMLDKVGMGKFAHHRPTELSGGQQQRIAIARALLGKPSIIMADEPTGALDTTTSQQIMNLLMEQMALNNTTVVIITHSLEVAKQCHRSIFIRDGLIQEAAQ